ncbi:MAG: glycosyltransferase family 39 protein, partial [Verrucomicrobiota bacterium]|nr:glycosyltransferase family 39 protein [Verrucomicrobiota bacterium]
MSSSPLLLPSPSVPQPSARSQPATAAPAPQIETRAFAACCVLLFVLRIIYAHSLRVDSDEPQHLHVVWGWANGLLQYRDLFDNHTPLFQMLLAPVFRMFGERPDILVPMRLAMVPFFAGSVWCLFKIGEALFSVRIARWITITGALMPGFFLTSTEFRTDDLWMLFWFATLAIGVVRPPTPARAWGAGFTCGLAFA